MFSKAVRRVEERSPWNQLASDSGLRLPFHFRYGGADPGRRLREIQTQGPAAAAVHIPVAQRRTSGPHVRPARRLRCAPQMPVECTSPFLLVRENACFRVRVVEHLVYN